MVMINLNSQLEAISYRYGYELYLEDALYGKANEQRIRLRIDSELDTFHLKISRSWKTTKIELVLGAFASQVSTYLCGEVVSQKNVITNLLQDPEKQVSSYALEVDHKNFEQVGNLDDGPHVISFHVEAMTPESSIEHGLLNDKESALLELASSIIFALLPRPTNSYSNPEEVIGFPEGATTQVLVNKYERDPRNRSAAIAAHGYLCLACGFDFEKVYGDLGRDFIIVHHVVPVSLIGPDYVINPSRDLVTLCANCHAMIHRENPPLSLEDLKMKVLSN